MARKPVVAVVLALLLVPALALAGNGRPGPDQILRSPKLLARYLQLTPDQVTQEQQFFQTLFTTLKGLRAQEGPLQDQLKTLLGASSPDACAVGAIVVQLDSLRDQERAALASFDQSLSAILTPDQLAKYNALKDAAHIGDTPTP